MNERINSAVNDVLKYDYFKEFLQIYGLTISVAEQHPEQANNEVRNAVTHLGRALQAKSEDVADEQIEAARRHLKRARLDCLKLCIITKHSELHSQVYRIEMDEGLVSRPIKTKLRKIRNARLCIFIKESLGDDVLERLETLFADMADLQDELLDGREIPGRVYTATRRYFGHTMSFVQKATFAVVCSVGAGFLFSVMFPDSSPFLNNARTDFANIIHPSAEQESVSDIEDKSSEKNQGIIKDRNEAAGI